LSDTLVGTVTEGNIIYPDGTQQTTHDYVEAQKIPEESWAALGALVGGRTTQETQTYVPSQTPADLLKESTKQPPQDLREYAKIAGTYRPPKRFSRYDILLKKAS
jgi:hypothetical protein